MNYKVRLHGGSLWISPPIDEEAESLVPMGRTKPVKESCAVLVNRHGEVEDIHSVRDAIRALYDTLQTSDRLKQGDTFTFMYHMKPFAKVDGVHVLPVY